MKIKISFLAVLLFFTLTGYAQKSIKTEQVRQFEQDLAYFRYNLNKELDKIDIEKIRQVQFDKKDHIVILIDEFYDTHKEEISAYRKFLLSEKSQIQFKTDWKEYTKITNKEFDNQISYVKEHNNLVPLANLMFINPFDHADFYKNLYLSTQKSMEEIATYSIRKTIAAPIISTKKINSELWEIIDNSYNQVYKYTYNVAKEDIVKFEVYERNK